MDAMLSAILVDGVVNPWWVAAASGVLLTVVAGITTGVILNYLSRRQAKVDHADEKEKTGVQTILDQLGLAITAEIEKRESTVAKLERECRAKDESLGRDISQIREVFSNFLGRSNLPCPEWNKEK